VQFEDLFGMWYVLGGQALQLSCAPCFFHYTSADGSLYREKPSLLNSAAAAAATADVVLLPGSHVCVSCQPGRVRRARSG
jgi:hypothetical protein